MERTRLRVGIPLQALSNGANIVLKRSDRLNGVCATDGLHARFRESGKFHLQACWMWSFTAPATSSIGTLNLTRG